MDSLLTIIEWKWSNKWRAVEITGCRVSREPRDFFLSPPLLHEMEKRFEWTSISWMDYSLSRWRRNRHETTNWRICVRNRNFMEQSVISPFRKNTTSACIELVRYNKYGELVFWWQLLISLAKFLIIKYKACICNSAIAEYIKKLRTSDRLSSEKY